MCGELCVPVVVWIRTCVCAYACISACMCMCRIVCEYNIIIVLLKLC